MSIVNLIRCNHCRHDVDANVQGNELAEIVTISYRGGTSHFCNWVCLAAWLSEFVTLHKIEKDQE